jgi:hypothetical protein
VQGRLLTGVEHHKAELTRDEKCDSCEQSNHSWKLPQFSPNHTRGRMLIGKGEFPMKITLAATLCLLLGACDMQMVNTSNPGANYSVDYNVCQYQAAQMYPVQMQTSTTPSVTNTNCNVYGSTANCTSTTSAGQTYNSGGDINLGNRLAATFSCMDARGWRMQSTASQQSSRSSSYQQASNRPSRSGESCVDSKQCGFGEICVVQPHETTGVCH